MTNLTDKLKKGELKLGEHYYYTTIFSPTVYIQNFTRDVISFQDFKETVAEVLAPVPSYEEYQQLLSEQLAKNEGVEINAELEAENTKLKELLKKCLEVFEMVAGETIYFAKSVDECIDKINQVLGEE